MKCSAQCRIGFWKGERGFLYSLLFLLLLSIIYLMSQMSAGGRATLGDLRVAHVILKSGCTQVNSDQVRKLYAVYGERTPTNGSVRTTEFKEWLLAQDGSACEALKYENEE